MTFPTLESGWVLEFDHRPGIADKVYSEPNKGLYIVNHSIVGTPAAALGRFLSTQRDAKGDYTDYAAASVMFINPKVGPPIQMYPVTASTWTSGGREANTTMWAVENEGGAPGNESEPLNENQVSNLFLIARVWERVTGRKATREIFREHGEVARQYGYKATACPSNRIAPFYLALAGHTEEHMSSAEYDRIVRVLTGRPAGDPVAEAQLDDWNKRGNSLLAGYAIEQADQDKLEACEATVEEQLKARLGGAGS